MSSRYAQKSGGRNGGGMIRSVLGLWVRWLVADERG